MSGSVIPIDLLRAIFIYRPRTGEFLNRRTGRPAGWINDEGYRVVKVKVDGRRVQIAAHKAAFAMHHGRYAEGEVDHRDPTDRQNLKIRNLREATRQQNMANIRRRGRLPKGVAKSGRIGKPFKAQIKIDGRNICLGRFVTKQEAHAAYMAKAVEVHGEFARAA